MTDMMREMIEQLMGASRAQEEGKKLPSYDHHSVCRAYLMDCCPREILTDTRLESFVYCRKMHEPAHKADYNREQAKRDHFYDIESFDALDECVRAVDYEVDKIKEKIKKDTEQMTDSQEYIKTQKIFELNEKIGAMLVEVETLGGQGMVKESMEVSKNVEELKRKKRELEAEVRQIAPVQQRLRVCEACGAQLNILDHESRLADHYGGKMHLGMVEIREKYEQLREKVEERRVARRNAEDKERQERRDRHDRDDDDKHRRDSSRSRSPRTKSSRHRSRSPRKSGSSKKRDRSRSRERRRDRH
ncbi:hypothetical protein Ddc_05034 [Ditylenchus destructor]|nr:hypothetical protein Ddc_05034 [Ditylenchus destructor]